MTLDLLQHVPFRHRQPVLESPRVQHSMYPRVPHTCREISMRRMRGIRAEVRNRTEEAAGSQTEAAESEIEAEFGVLVSQSRTNTDERGGGGRCCSLLPVLLPCPSVAVASKRSSAESTRYVCGGYLAVPRGCTNHQGHGALCRFSVVGRCLKSKMVVS